MKITFVIETPGMAGGVKVVAIYAEALARRGHSVVIVSTPPRAIPVRRKLGSLLKGRGWPSAATRRVSYFDDSPVDLRTLDRWRPVADEDVPDADVVIATWWETAEWVHALSPRKGAKVYFVQHHEVFPHLPVSRVQATYRLPLHKIVVARWLEEVMREQYGDAHVDVVPNSVDRQQFFAPPRGKQAVPTVGFVYSTTALKGTEVVLRALRLLERRPLRIVSFGSEPPTPELPLPRGTEFTLLPAQSDIRHLYACCDVWVSASYSEGFYLPALEAMACRTPVVSTRTGWPAEALKDRYNGALVDVGDAAALARALDWTLSLPEAEWRALSERAYATSSEGSWEASVDLFEQALERARRKAAGGASSTVPSTAAGAVR